MLNPDFLVVRYAPGAAGKFLTSLLMASHSVAHFDKNIEHNKNSTQCIDYFHQHFPNVIGDWLKYEPKHTDAWNLNFLSMTYPRNDTLSQLEFNKMAVDNGSQYFWESVTQNKLIPWTTNKNTVPDFFKYSKFVTILIDEKSVKWYHRAKWYKHYAIEYGRIYNKTSDPQFHSQTMHQYYEKFKHENKIFVDESFQSFVRTNIIKNPIKYIFMDKSNFNQPVDQVFVNLSDLLSVEKCIEAVNQICKEFSLYPVPRDVIIEGHRHWASCHDFKYA
jgi:hypothetical protein